MAEILETGMKEQSEEVVAAVAVDIWVLQTTPTELGLFAMDSALGSRVVFRSTQEAEIVFTDGDPLQNATSPIQIPAGPEIPFTLQTEISGLPREFPFEFRVAGQAPIPMRLGVVEEGGLSEVGFLLDLNGDTLVSATGRQVLGGELLIRMTNFSPDPVVLRLTPENGPPEDIFLPRQDPQTRRQTVGMFGRQAMLTFAASGIDTSGQTGGTDQAEILVFPPP